MRTRLDLLNKFFQVQFIALAIASTLIAMLDPEFIGTLLRKLPLPVVIYLLFGIGFMMAYESAKLAIRWRMRTK